MVVAAHGRLVAFVAPWWNVNGCPAVKLEKMNG